VSYDNPAPAGIRVITKFSPLAFLLFLCTPRIHLDGGPAVPRKWGVTDIPVSPGHHQLRCYFPYLFYRAVGDSSTELDVAPGQLVTLRWKAPWLVFFRGKWSTESVQPIVGASASLVEAGRGYSTGVPAMSAAGPPPAGPQPAAWHPDPTARHQFRYWDGNGWTSHVSDNGVATTDVL
jgi:hypothetical protein